MIKEILISLYLTVFNIIFSFFKLFPLKNKTVFLSTFGDNAFFTARELAGISDQHLIFINNKQCKVNFSSIPTDKKTIYCMDKPSVAHLLHSVYHLATAKYVFVDTYAGELAAIRFKKGVTCVQLWHAAGAVKKFGWSEPETVKRNNRAKKRFQKVYDQFQFIPVGSPEMADIFAEAFHLSTNRMLQTGVPQTDFFFDEDAKRAGVVRIHSRYPELQGKRVILYAPTFRKSSLRQMELALDTRLLSNSFDEDHILLIRLHPAVSGTTKIPAAPNILVVSDYPLISDLLAVSDVLVTDYSSLPVEFSLLRKKMIFYTYDLESYRQTQGLWSWDVSSFPGPIARTTAEVIAHITDPAIDFEQIDEFKNRWNAFSTGNSARRLIDAVYGTRTN